MIRYLIPRLSFGRWSGGAISPGDDVEGWALCVQWLGMLIEIGVGSVRRGRWNWP